MATNMVHTPGNQLEVVLASIVSGQPTVLGQLPGVALTSSETTTNKVTLKTDGVFNLTVTGAVNAGDIVYWATPDVISTTNTGVRFGYALQTLAATGLCKVKVGY
jgi:predicted RecA/RadA family phage recombinase